MDLKKFEINNTRT